MILLVISDNEKKTYHYVYIKNLNKLIRSPIKYDGAKFCNICV